MDEAAAKLRMERDSVPEELDEISRRLKQLEIEREAIKRENDTEKDLHNSTRKSLNSKSRNMDSVQSGKANVDW